MSNEDEKQPIEGGQNEQLRHFFCRPCIHYFVSSDWYIDEIEDIIYTPCDICKQATQEIPSTKINSYKGAAAAKGKHTGPKTEAGKKAGVEKRKGTATGPKTQAGKDRSKLNGYKHGNYSKEFTLLAPALPGKFPMCGDCEYNGAGCGTEFKYCPVNIKPMVELLRAYQERDNKAIREIHGLQQARALQVLEMMFQAVFKYGVLNPKEMRKKGGSAAIDYSGKDTEKWEEITLEWMANPLIKRIPEFMAAIGSTAEQNLMTVKSEQSQDNFDGFLEKTSEQQQEVKNFQTQLIGEIEKLGIGLENAKKQRDTDDALNEYEQQQEHERNNH